MMVGRFRVRDSGEEGDSVWRCPLTASHSLYRADDRGRLALTRRDRYPVYRDVTETDLLDPCCDVVDRMMPKSRGRFRAAKSAIVIFGFAKKNNAALAHFCELNSFAGVVQWNTEDKRAISFQHAKNFLETQHIIRHMFEHLIRCHEIE